MSHTFLALAHLTLGVGLALSPISIQAQDARWSLEELWRIGSSDSTTWITRVSDLVVSDDGKRIIIGQPLASEVVVIDGDTGEPRYALGRRGQGPGEFGTIKMVGVVGDTIFAADLQQQRVVLFSLSKGAHLETSRVDSDVIPQARRAPLPMRLTADGTYWAEPPLNYTLAANGVVAEIPILLLGREGNVLTHVTTKDVLGTIAFAPVGNGYSLFQQPLVRPSIVAYAGDGSSILHVENHPDGRAAVRRFSKSGELLYDRVLQRRREAVTEAMLDSLYTEFAEAYSRMGPQMASAAHDAAREHVVAPDHLPSFMDAVLANDGSAWLRVHLSSEWLVLNPTGDVVGSVMVPVGLRLAAVHEREAWGIWKDELDVPHIIKYRLKAR